jgi:sigma-B regulation protein RsbU (phosphoserine phosphatase)
MALTYSLLRAEAGRGASPGKTLLNVNRNLLEINSAGMFITVLYGVLDYSTREFTYARAGHLLPVVMDDEGRKMDMKTSLGQPLGITKDIHLDEQRVVIPPWGTVLIYSDGLSEAVNADGVEFGADRIPEVLAQVQQLNAQDTCKRLWEVVLDFCNYSKQQDDLTLVCFKPGG